MLKKSVLLIVLLLSFQSAAFSESLFSIIENHKSGALLSLIKAIRSGADVNQSDENGMTPLMRAASSSGNEELIIALIKHGAKIDACDSKGLTALMWACSHKGNEKAIEILLEAGADANLTAENQLSAMNFVTNTAVQPLAYDEPSSVKIVELLMKHGARLTRDNHSLQQVWLLAARSPDGLPLTKKLLESGFDINYSDADGITALMEAAMNNPDPAMTAFLLNAGANIDLKSKYDASALSYACKSNNGKVVRMLLRQTEKLNRKWAPDNILLHNAALNKNSEVIKQLLAYKMNVNSTDERGKTPLKNAARFSTPEIVKILVNAGADVNYRDGYGFSALMDAAEMNVEPEIIRILVTAGARIDFKDKQNGRSALDFALENENLKNSEVISLLRQGDKTE